MTSLTLKERDNEQPIPNVYNFKNYYYLFIKFIYLIDLFFPKRYIWQVIRHSPGHNSIENFGVIMKEYLENTIFDLSKE